MGLSQALATSTAGLRTTQAGMALVASNVANAETPGYVRKTMVQATTSAGANGVSVRISEIAREFDAYIQRQLRTETAGGSYADTRAQLFSRLQRVYGTPGSDAALETVFSKFTDSLQALTTSPDSAAARAAVLSAAKVLAQQLNSMTTDIQALRSDAEFGLSDAATRANYAMQQIAAINRQLATSTGNDAAAATLLDQRDTYIDELSRLMDIKVVKGDFNQINIFTNSGIQLVGVDASTLSFDAQGTVTPSALYDRDPAKRTLGTLTLVNPTGGSMDLIATGAIRSGEIAAFVEMRDTVLVQAQTQLDQIAAAMSSALSDETVASTAAPGAVLPQLGFDIDTAGLLAGNTIHLTYTDTLTSVVHNVSIVRVDDPAALPLDGSATADPNDEVIGVDFSGGLAAVATALNARFGGRVNVSNPAGTTLRFLDDGNANNSAINAVSATRTLTSFTGGGGELPFFNDAGVPFSGAITSLGSQSIGYAGRISVNGALLADPSRLVVYQAGVAAGDGTRPNFIYDQLMEASLEFAPGSGIGALSQPYSGTLGSFLRQVISFQGEAAENAESLATGQEVVVNALAQRFSDGAAVNIDVEMASLLTLQNAYGANARVLATVKEMFELLMQI
jgi:flagellar hook-associated protein 1 FlgK